MGSKLWGFAALLGGLALTVATGGAAAGLWSVAQGTIGATVTAWIAGATVVSSLVAGRIAESDARRAANASLQDRVTTIRSTDEPRAILYGRQRVGGVLTYVSPPFGARQESVTLVITLVGHPCDAIEQIWINDEPVTLDADGVVIGGPSGKWQSRTSDIWSQFVAGPPVWSAGAPTLNRIAAPSGATAVVSVMWEAANGAPYTLATPGVDYVVLENGFDIGLLNEAMLGRSVAITYNKRVTIAGSISIKRFTGYETGAARRDTDLEANSGGQWLSTATGDGICRLHVTMNYNETMFADGVPSFSAVVRGMRVYDARLDSTNGGSGSHRLNDPATWAWDRNPANAAAHYLMHDWGLGLASTRIDWALVRAAASACDTMMLLDGTPTYEAQFTIDGFLSTSQSPLDNLDEICAAMAGFCAPSGERWRIMAGAWTAPAADAFLRDDHVIGDAEITVYQDALEVFNSVRGRYRDATWQVTEFPSYSSATYVAQDGEEIWRDVDLPLTLHPIRAQRVAKLLLFRARQSLTFAATFSIAAWRYQPGDRLRLMLTEYGWDAVSQDGGTGKVFRVVDRQWVYPDQVRLVLLEDTASIYSWAFDEASTPDPTPNTTLPSASVVQAPSNFEGSASPTDFVAMPDGTKVGYVRLTWDAITDSGVLAGGWLEVRWKRAQEPVETLRILRISPYSTEYRLEGIRANEVLNVGLAAVNASQARSSTTLIEGNIGGLSNGVFSVQRAFEVAAGGTLFSGNLLRNSTFQLGLAGWTWRTPIAAYGCTVERPAAVSSLDGPPAWNLIMYEAGTGGVSLSDGAIFLVPERAYKVQAGERYAFACRFVLDGCNAVCHIQWLNDAGNQVGPGVFGQIVSQSVAGNPKIIAQYTEHSASVVYGTAPAGATQARPHIIKLGTSFGAVSAAYPAEPMFYELVGPDAVAVWSPGETSGTLAVVRTVAGPLAVGQKGATTTPTHTLLDETTIPAGDLLITVTGLMIVTPGAGGLAMAAAVMYVTGAGVNGPFGGGNSVTVQGGRSPAIDGMAARAPVEGQVAIAYSIPAFAGGALRVQIAGVHYAVGDATTATMNNLQCRVEVKV